MSYFQIVVCCTAVLLCVATPPSATADQLAAAAPTRTAELTEEQAKGVAEAAFRKENVRITTYSILVGPHEPHKWLFLFEGTDESARPGCHAIVLVEKSSGKTEVKWGE